MKDQLTQKSTDQEIKDFMLSSTTTIDWNSKRDRAKDFRSERWIATHLDSSGLIKKCKIVDPPRERRGVLDKLREEEEEDIKI